MINNEPKFTIELVLRIDWSEMDIFKHVNNVAFFKYIQAARVNYWEQTDLVKHYHIDGVFPMLVNCDCKFLQPLHYPGNVMIKSSVVFIKNTSFGIKHLLYNNQMQQVAEANDVMVFVNEATGEKIIVPQAIREKITELELG